jgi:CBS domain-containing protein
MPEATKAQDIMTRDVTCLRREDKLLDAARVLFDNRWAGAPVLEDGLLIGVLCLTDVLAQERSVHHPTPLIIFDALLYLGTRRFEKELKKVTAMTVGQAMTTPARTVTPDTTVADIAAMMIDDGLSTVPVVDGASSLVGVIGRRDVVRLILGRERS